MIIFLSKYFSTFRIHNIESELQRLISLLGMGTSIYNIETRVGENGKTYIMECSPRGGGNRLAEVVHLMSGINMIKASVQAAVGKDIDDIFQRDPINGYWSEVILHTNRSGIFRGVNIDKSLEENILERLVWVDIGDKVDSFRGANASIGNIILRFDTQDELMRTMHNINQLITVELG